MTYDEALAVLLDPNCDDDAAEEAADRLVRYGMFLRREDVTPMVERALSSESPSARVKVVDHLADYDVPLTQAMISTMEFYLSRGDAWERLGIMFALLRDAKTYEAARDRVETWIQNGQVLDEDVSLVWRCLEDLEKKAFGKS